jgi:hypothetical protein
MGAWANNNDYLNLQSLRQQILAMQQANDQVISPADVAKTILEELQGFNPLNNQKHSFWYVIGIVLLMIYCFCLLSVGAQKIKRQLLGLDIEMHREHLRNRVGGDIGDWAWILDWEMMELAKSLHGKRVGESLLLFSTWCLDLSSHISLEENNLL